MQEFFRISCYTLFYIATIQLLGNSYRLLKKTVLWVVFLAAAIALLAIVQQVGSPEKIYWLRSVPANAHPFGPWINPNQFAGFMEMLSPLALSLFLFYKPRLARETNWREKFVAFFTMPGGNIHLLLGFAATLMALSVFVSLCRGGILVISLSALIFLLLFNMKKPKQGRTAALIIFGCVLLAVSWFGWNTILAEFNHGLDASGNLTDGRFQLWADSLGIIKSHFLLGSGFGTYIDIFPSFRSFAGSAIFDHAHNDYIELLTDGGVIAFFLAAWFVIAVLRHGWRKIRSRRDWYAVLLGIGTTTGIVAMLLHSLTDFNMHNGADGLYFFFLCGLLVVGVNSRFDAFHPSSTLLRKQRRKQALPAFLCGAVVLTAALVLVQGGALRALASYNAVKDVYISRQLDRRERQKVSDRVSKAERLDPLEARYSFKLGTIAWFWGERRNTMAAFLRAARKNPMEGAALQRLGLLVGNADQADLLLEKGYERALNKDGLALTYVQYLLVHHKRKAAMRVLAARLRLNPGLSEKWLPLFERYSFSREEIGACLPHAVDAWQGYGSFLERSGDAEGAEYFCSKALDYLDNADKINPAWFSRLIWLYRRHQKPEKALEVLREAVKTVPNYAPFHVELGDYYLRRQLTYLARQEFERALELDPRSRAARRQLRRLGLDDAY